MKQIEEVKNKNCVLMDCNRKAVDFCNNCRIPVCDIHSKRIDSVYLCINCLSYIKKSKLR